MKIEWDFTEFTNFANKISDTSNFMHYIKLAADDIAKDLQLMLQNNTPYKTGKLKGGWLTGGYTITATGKGYEVKLLNDVEYAYYVNYGHYSHNKFNKGGTPYVVKDAHRTVSFYDGIKDSTYVYGHFFVEKTLLTYAKSSVLTNLILDQIQKWWEGCF